MLGRIIEIQTSGNYLSSNRGFLIIKSKDLTSQIAIPDIAVLIISKNGVTLTSSLLNKLLSFNVMVIFTDSSYHPSSILYPFNNNYEQTGRLYKQIKASEPLKKQLWKEIVKDKISKQSNILSLYGKDYEDINYYIQNIKSGDSDNYEAIVAKKYWNRIFNNFRRSNKDDDINSMLNYGYAIVRSCVARYISAVGLSPSLGVFHKNINNSFCLVDDLMEPFRPYVDMLVKDLFENGFNKLTPEVKQELAKVLIMDIKTQTGVSPLSITIKDFIYSYYKSIEQKNVKYLNFTAPIMKDN